MAQNKEALSLTEEQAAAVNASVAENLVSAAAGSGKTKVLSERIVSRIKSGDTSIDRLLIVTYTRAAARQMRERISAALSSEYDLSHSPRIRRQISLIPGADICTMDSFCIDILKKNFFRVNVPPDFGIIDDNAEKILRDEVLSDVLEALYDEGDEAFLSLSESVGTGKDDNTLRKMILKIYDFTSAFADPEKWIDEKLSAHEADSPESSYFKTILDEEITGHLNDIDELLTALHSEAEKIGLSSYAEVIYAEKVDFKAYLDEYIRSGNGSIFTMFELKGFKGKKAPDELKNEKEIIQDKHKAIKAIFNRALEIFEVRNAPFGSSYENIRALCDCVKKFRTAYLEEKLSRKELEFSDCEYFALKALEEDNEAADELRKKYDEIYIDEYQDTNPLQDRLFSLISKKSSGEPNLFIVGDVKQSIYRFRHSDPTLFAAKAKAFGKEPPQRKMLLTKNFRSRRDVLDSVNCVFKKIMRENTAQIEYNEEHILNCGAKYTEYDKNKSELYILAKNASSEGDDLEREQLETYFAALKIREMVDSGFLVSENGMMRKVKYSDFAVLTRKITGKADAIAKVFELMDIPCVCTAKRDFFASFELRLAISILECVDNPLSDIPLAALMRSPIFAFDENELARIRLCGRKEAFYKNVICMSKKEGELAEKCKSFLSRLTSWRDRSQVVSVESFLSYIYEDTQIFSFVGALPGGASRQANLTRLLSIASNYEKTQYRGLYSFVKYIEKTIEAGGGVSTDSSDARDSVLITTIHASKGLEFPVVILIGCSSQFNDEDYTSQLILSPEGGIALINTDRLRHLRYKTPEYQAISLMIKRDDHAEQMRLLYVAMTRAMEKLILIGTAPSPSSCIDKGIEMLQNGVSDHTLRSMNNYLDYLLAGAVGEDAWDIHTVDSLPPILPAKKDVGEEIELEASHDAEAERRLSYVYPYSGIESIPSKMSVSEIKRMSTEDDEAAEMYMPQGKKRIPRFMQKEKTLTGAARGTAYHRVLELIDPNETDVAGAIKRFTAASLLEPEAAECVDISDIEAFLSSPLGDMMRKAKNIYREVSFTMPLAASDIFGDDKDETVCVQGTIDCFFEMPDGDIILVDFKTDYYDDPNDLIKKYKKQLDLYESAIFMKFSHKCAKKFLYLFHNNDIISV